MAGVIRQRWGKCNNAPKTFLPASSSFLYFILICDALAHLISSALTPPTPLPTCPTNPLPLDSRSRSGPGADGAVGSREEVIIWKQAGTMGREIERSERIVFSTICGRGRLGNYCKYFETRRKATRGARSRWQHVVANASVSMYLCSLAKDGMTIIRPQPEFFVDPPPASLGCLSPVPSSCVRPCTQYHLRHTHPYRFVTSPSSLCRRLCQCLVS